MDEFAQMRLVSFGKNLYSWNLPLNIKGKEPNFHKLKRRRVSVN